MKEPLRGIRFRTVPEILQAVDRSIRTINTSRSHKGLSPCDFHLIPKMKEPLRGIRFRTVPETTPSLAVFRT